MAIFRPQPQFHDNILQSVPQLIDAEMQDMEHTRLTRALHMHDDRIEIRLIRRGKGIHLIDARRYATKAGDILLFQPDVLHDECADPMDSMEIMGCSIGNVRMKGLKPNHILPEGCNPVLRDGACYHEAEALLSMICESAVSDQKISKEMQTHLVSGLLLLLHQAGIQQDASEQAAIYEVGRAVQDFIDAHYLEDISIADIAKHLHMGESYISHSFKKSTGYSVLQYIIRRRIGESQSWLLMSDLPITEIAMKVGYNSVSNFHNAFHRAVSMTPQQYRIYWKKK